MIAEAPNLTGPTLWGLSPSGLHERFWASRGVQVVPVGHPSLTINPHAELYLLVEQSRFVIMSLRRPLDLLCWLKPDLLVVRLAERVQGEYKEIVESRPDGRFLRFRREYDVKSSRLARVGLTSDPELAKDWAALPADEAAWKTIRRLVPSDLRASVRAGGRIYSGSVERDSARFVRDLSEAWARPDATIQRARRCGRFGWADQDARQIDADRVNGPVWIGAGRSIPDGQVGVGPAVMWDDPDLRPEAEQLEWRDIEAKQSRFERPLEQAAPYTSSLLKRGFDILFALLALAMTLPLYPFIIAAIMIEDGWPVFFAHKRESTDSREFGCLKFRTMYRNAEAMKAELVAANEADGPQFFMEDDPRITKVGKILRKLQLDEIPQFWNVLSGNMSVVGPRPSPYSENQYCPGWREARLSVRPGVTGLWQIRRTRSDGADFQEWIRYDIEYVERASFKLDLYIIWKTIMLVFGALART